MRGTSLGRRFRCPGERALYARQRRPSAHHRLRPGFAVEFLFRRWIGPYFHAAHRPRRGRRPDYGRAWARIENRLRNGFLREPRVSVEVEAYRPFFILGEVTTAGQYPFINGMTVETAVAIAGGFTPRAYKSERRAHARHQWRAGGGDGSDDPTDAAGRHGDDPRTVLLSSAGKCVADGRRKIGRNIAENPACDAGAARRIVPSRP